MQELLRFLKHKEQVRMDPGVYKKNLEKGVEMILLDVRTREEFEDRHITGANLLPMDRIETDLQFIYPDKTKIYVIYCRSGVRSYNAYLFYFLPVLFVSWFLDIVAGLAISVIITVLWFLMNYYNMSANIPIYVHYSNTAALLCSMSGLAYLISILKVKDHELLLAKRDPLTGAVNLRGLRLELARKVKQNIAPLTLVYFDLDNFKRVNDRFGHKEGDRVLCVVSRIVKAKIRDDDCFARVGGDEFVILFSDLHIEKVRKRISNINNDLLKAMKRNKWPVTFSIGSVTFALPRKRISEMIGAADKAMYYAKKNGKNRIIYTVMK